MRSCRENPRKGEKQPTAAAPYLWTRVSPTLVSDEVPEDEQRQRSPTVSTPCPTLANESPPSHQNTPIPFSSEPYPLLSSEKEGNLHHSSRRVVTPSEPPLSSTSGRDPFCETKLGTELHPQEPYLWGPTVSQAGLYSHSEPLSRPTWNPSWDDIPKAGPLSVVAPATYSPDWPMPSAPTEGPQYSPFSASDSPSPIARESAHRLDDGPLWVKPSAHSTKPERFVFPSTSEVAREAIAYYNQGVLFGPAFTQR